LEKQIHSHQAFVQQNPDLVSNVAYTRAMGRDRLQHRAYAVAENGQFTVISPAAKSASSPLVNVVFSGQGAQWPGMGKELIETDPAFRECIGTMDTVLQALKHPPSWTIMGKKAARPFPQLRVQVADEPQLSCKSPLRTAR
jgi:acyl transferase domain-containing protein